MAAKPTKRSDQKKPWNHKPLRRRINTRPERQYILIVCEGARTEPNYFEAIGRLLPQHLVEVKPMGVGDNTLSLVKRALKIWRDTPLQNLGRRYDELWVVFDRDSFPADRFHDAIHFCEEKRTASKAQRAEDPEKQPSNPLMWPAWSNEAFELWYVLHFEDRKTAMPREDYFKVLSKYLKEPYQKRDPKMYEKLQQAGNETKAIRRAQKLLSECEDAKRKPADSNPCTTVFKLVNRLNEFKTV